MPTPTIHNVSNGKINMRVFCSSNIFSCQEILSSELSFSVQHLKQLLSGSYVWRALQLSWIFNLSSYRSISYTVLVLTLREKNEAKQKSINFRFNFIFIVEQTLSEKCPEHIIIEQNSPQNPLLLLFFVGNIAPEFQKPQNPTIFYFCRKIMPCTTLYLAETAPNPTIFYFSGQKFLPRTAPDLPRTKSGASSPSEFNTIKNPHGPVKNLIY